MSDSTATVIRRNDTAMEDPFHFQIEQCAQPSQPGHTPPVATPQVRIAENTGEHVVLEITCCCGTKSYVKCEYANA